jgi:predicted phosphodiesterase
MRAAGVSLPPLGAPPGPRPVALGSEGKAYVLVTDFVEPLGRLAVLSDLHGNLPALEAILEDIGREGPTSLLCLGDYVGYAPLHREVVEALRQQGAVMLQGSLDAAAAKGNTTPQMKGRLDDTLQRLLAGLPVAARVRMAGAEVVAFHGNLPDDSPLFNADPRLAAELHAISHYAAELGTLDADSFFPVLADYLTADVYVFGHTHREAYRRIAGKQFVNVAAAGRPRGNVRASYALLTSPGGKLRVEFRKVAYNVRAVVDAIKAHCLPSRFAEELETPPE